MRFRGLIFDMDGTLGDTIPFIFTTLRDTFSRFTGRVYSDAEITLMFGPSEEGVIRPRVAAHQYNEALAYFLDRYAALHTSQPFPGVLPLLKRLKAEGVRVGVATGKGPRTAAISMRAFGLHGYIDHLEAGVEQGGIKPEQIRRILAAWDLSPAQAAYVGDARSDMADARAAGVLPIGAAWSRTATVTPADTPYCFHSIPDFAAWLEQE